MPRKYTDARKASNKAWDAANLDRISIALPRGHKDKIKAKAAASGESVNGFIGRLLDSAIMEAETCVEDRDITADTMQKAKEAAAAEGETVQQFIDRAVDTQARRDEIARRMDRAGK